LTEILFYHLTETRLEETLPGLVERSLARDWRVVLQCASREHLEMLDVRLWTFSDVAFIAHGCEMDEFAADQPVFLTLDADSNPNGAQIRFCLEGARAADFQSYQRLVVMFDGNDGAQLENARAQWREFKAQGGDVTYWQQNLNRGWEKKA